MCRNISASHVCGSRWPSWGVSKNQFFSWIYNCLQQTHGWTKQTSDMPAPCTDIINTSQKKKFLCSNFPECMSSGNKVCYRLLSVLLTTGNNRGPDFDKHGCQIIVPDSDTEGVRSLGSFDLRSRSFILRYPRNIWLVASTSWFRNISGRNPISAFNIGPENPGQ